MRYEYRVVPAPRRGEKARGVKTTEDRFALALTQAMNALGAEGWEYLRADTLPCDERAGLTGGTKTSFQNMLVFRRVLDAGAEAAPAPAPLPAAAAALPPLRLEAPEGAAPPLGPAKPELAAE